MLVINQDSKQVQHINTAKEQVKSLLDDQAIKTIYQKHFSDTTAPVIHTVDGNTIKLPDNYRRLQTLCKDAGLKASGKKAVLMQRLNRHHAGTATAEDYKGRKASSSRPKTVSYREAQRCISYWFKQVPGLTKSCKNCGWENVLTLALELDDQSAIEKTANSNSPEHLAMVSMLNELLKQAALTL